MIWRIATLRRGKVDPPEKLDDFNSYMVETMGEREKAELHEAKLAERARLWEMKMRGEG